MIMRLIFSSCREQVSQTAIRGNDLLMTIMQRIKSFMASPAGKQLIEQGRRQLADPANRAKLRALAEKAAKKKRK
jgi:hypothetical protein